MPFDALKFSLLNFFVLFVLGIFAPRTGRTRNYKAVRPGNRLPGNLLPRSEDWISLLGRGGWIRSRMMDSPSYALIEIGRSARRAKSDRGERF